ncbi:MAG: hypothetical protein AAB368_00250, partial [bacterium]
MIKPGSPVTAVRPVTDVHVAPDAAAELITQARLGDLGEVLPLLDNIGEVLPLSPASGDWLRIRLAHDPKEGWAARSAFVEGAWPPAGEQVWRVQSLFANLHDGPSVRSRLLLTLMLGTPVLPLSPPPLSPSGGE